MCGISGYAGYEKNETLLKRMTGIISHRGPDEEGLFIDKTIGLGMRRLSIIDTATGQQPIFNEDRSVVLVFNGEIYNYRQLMAELKEKGHSFRTHSDTETIVHLYEELGIDCLQKLRGMFAFALYDIRNDLLFLARDRIGIKPLYYYQKNKHLLFSSEIKGILESSDISREPNRAAIDSYLKFRYVAGPETMFQGIYKLPAGHYMTYQNGSTRIEQYWNPSDFVATASKAKILSDSEYQDRFDEIFQESIKLHLESDVSVGSYLSGGLDSSLVTAEAAKLSSSPIKTFCVGFGWDGDETKNAQLVANSLGAEHHEVLCRPEDLKFLPQMIWHYDEPVGDPIALPTFLLSKLAQQNVKVVLTGEGADEVLAGYLFHRVLMLTKKVKNVVPGFFLDSVIAPIIQKLPIHWIDSIFDYPAFLGEMGREKIAHFAKLSARGDPQEMYEFLITLFDTKTREKIYLNPSGGFAKESHRKNSTASFFEQIQLAQFSSWLPDNILLRQDKMSMANSVEARVPFLDHILVEFLLGVPPHLKLNSFLGKNKILARQYGKKILPRNVSAQKKKAFYIPTENYFQNPVFLEMLERTLNKNQVKRRGYFKPEAVEELIALAKTGKEFITAKQVFSLISLELWHQIFIEGNSWK